MSTKHSIAATKFLKDEKLAAWHNETLWMVRAKRDKLSHSIPEWEHLRDMACAIKQYTNSHLDKLLLQFEENAKANGAIVHWAKDAEEYRQTVYQILKNHHVKHFIKSKSMLAEECELNDFLETKGIETVESDLGERILQLMHKKPSHIVLPAIHIKKEAIGELFVREMGTDPGNNDQTYLTHAARKNLRQNDAACFESRLHGLRRAGVLLHLGLVLRRHDGAVGHLHGALRRHDECAGRRSRARIQEKLDECSARGL